MAFTLPAAELVALFMDSVGFGAHIITFAVCASKMLQAQPTGKRRIRWSLLWIAIALFVNGAFDVALHLYSNLQAFVSYTGPGGAVVVFSHPSSWPTVLRTVTTVLAGMISDVAWIYRCWTVWGRKWQAAALPVLIWIAMGICAVFQIYWQATLERDLAQADLLSSAIFQRWVIAFGVLSVALNTVTSSLVIFKLWRVSARSGQVTSFRSAPSRLSKVIEVVVESALLYTVALIIAVGVDLGNSLMVYGFSALALQLAGVAYDLIILRLHTAQTSTPSTGNAAYTNERSAPFALRVMQSTIVDARTDDHGAFSQAVSSKEDDWQSPV